MKKVLNFILLLVVGIIVVPSIVSAEIKEVEGITYSRVNIDYSLDNGNYIYLYGIISPTDYVVYDEDSENEEFYYFKDGAYREQNATPREIVKSHEIMWIYGNEIGYVYNDEYAILKQIDFNRSDLSDNCYTFNSDLTAKDGVTYYSYESNYGEYQPVVEFDVNRIHEYFVRTTCVPNDVVYQLTDAQITILENKIRSIREENAETYADKYNLDMRYYPIRVENEFINVFQTIYTDTDVSLDGPVPVDFHSLYKFYDLEGNELQELDDYYYLLYLEKSNLIVGYDNLGLHILDTDFNVIFENEDSNYSDCYIFDVDDNRLIIDYEDGEAEIITRYVVLDGENQTYDGEDLELRINGELSLLDKVYVNDVELSNDDFTTSEGSTIITLKNSYLKNLGKATYTLKATYTDGGVVTTTFVVNNAINNPATGDNLLSTIIIGSISLIAIICLLIVGNKRKSN